MSWVAKTYSQTVSLADLLPQVHELQSVQVPGLDAQFLSKPSVRSLFSYSLECHQELPSTKGQLLGRESVEDRDPRMDGLIIVPVVSDVDATRETSNDRRGFVVMGCMINAHRGSCLVRR